jgi:hypothetical protein
MPTYSGAYWQRASIAPTRSKDRVKWSADVMSSGRVSAICNGVRKPSAPQPARANVEIRTPPQIAAAFLRPLLHINECSPLVECDHLAINHRFIWKFFECFGNRLIPHSEVFVVSGAQVNSAVALERYGTIAVQLQLFCGVGRYVAVEMGTQSPEQPAILRPPKNVIRGLKVPQKLRCRRLGPVHWFCGAMECSVSVSSHRHPR